MIPLPYYQYMGANPNTEYEEGRAPLFGVAHNCQYPLIKLMLVYGVDSYNQYNFLYGPDKNYPSFAGMLGVVGHILLPVMHHQATEILCSMLLLIRI